MPENTENSANKIEKSVYTHMSCSGTGHTEDAAEVTEHFTRGWRKKLLHLGQSLNFSDFTRGAKITPLVNSAGI